MSNRERRAALPLWRRLRLRARVLRRRLALWRDGWLGPIAARLESSMPGARSMLVVEQAPLTEKRSRGVMLAVAHPKMAAGLGRYAAALAEGDAVIVVTVVGLEEGRRMRDTIAKSSGDSSAWILEELPALRFAVESAADSGVATGFVVRAGDDVGHALRREARRQRAKRVVLGWRPIAEPGSVMAAVTERNLGSSEREGGDLGSPAAAAERRILAPSLRAILEYPPAEVSIVAGNVEVADEATSARDAPAMPQRWLVPVAAGGDTLAALQTAAVLKGEKGSLTALRVLPQSATIDRLERAGARLSHTLELLGQPRAGYLVLRADDVATGVLQAVEERGYGGVVMAAPSETLIERLVLGAVQLAIASRCPTPVVVTKARSGATTYMMVRTWRMVYDRLPKLDEAEQVEVEADITAAATPRMDFYVMIGLSAMLAGFGLLLDSPAVIIGAMLVAPLMAAIVAVGLGVIEGRLPLIRSGLIGSLRGAGIAIAVGILVGMLHPRGAIGPEIASRTRPGLLDLGVALASGAAGAYALARKGVSASLAGVAIAAALVPPLAVSGIGVALGRWDVALGALLLFTTNFISIAAAGGVTFLLLGFGPSMAEAGERELMERGLQTAAWLLVGVALVLGVITWRLASDVRFERQLEQVLYQEIEQSERSTQFQPIEIETWEHSLESDGTLDVEVTVRLKAELAAGFSYQISREIQDALSARLGRPVALTLKIVPTRVLDARQVPTWTPSPTVTSTPSLTITPSPTASVTPSATTMPSPTATVSPTPLRATETVTGTAALPLLEPGTEGAMPAPLTGTNRTTDTNASGLPLVLPATPGAAAAPSPGPERTPSLEVTPSASPKPEGVAPTP